MGFAKKPWPNTAKATMLATTATDIAVILSSFFLLSADIAVIQNFVAAHGHSAPV